MALKVIGAGFGRTGTLSLKTALERLGLGPCYHMFELVERPEHIQMWQRLAFGEAMDWELLFRDFQSTVDWPTTYYWRELADRYPAAKIVLSLRDPDAWYQSMTDTIFQALTMPLPQSGPESRRQQMAMARKLIFEGTFSGRADKEHAIAIYHQHNETVRRTCDPRRLLAFDVKEGWEPLCRFLGVPQPEEPFPRLNDTASIQARMKAMREAGGRGSLRAAAKS